MPQTRASVDWLRNELHISGPAADIARFQQAAAGSGVVPWVLDLARIEEDYFLPMAVPVNGARAISVAGARILARRLRDAIAVNQQRAVNRMLTDRSCPFDLQRLLQPSRLTVYARYVRRGGLDINPYRSSMDIAPDNRRLVRQ